MKRTGKSRPRHEHGGPAAVAANLGNIRSSSATIFSA